MRAARSLGWMVVLAMAFGLGASAALADDTQDTVAGVWVKHDVHFTYMGLTTFYSCDGLENKLKLLLRAAGARESRSRVRRAQ